LTIDAADWDTALDEYHRIQGWEPYKPMEDKERTEPCE